MKGKEICDLNVYPGGMRRRGGARRAGGEVAGRRVTVSALPSSPGLWGLGQHSQLLLRTKPLLLFFCVKVLLILSLVCTERFF